MDREKSLKKVIDAYNQYMDDEIERADRLSKVKLLLMFNDLCKHEERENKNVD